jgi:hypothetical protein
MSATARRHGPYGHYRLPTLADFKHTFEKYGIDYKPPLGGEGGQLPSSIIDHGDWLQIVFANGVAYKLVKM